MTDIFIVCVSVFVCVWSLLALSPSDIIWRCIHHLDIVQDVTETAKTVPIAPTLVVEAIVH